jgi:hypothetical protein
VVAEVAMRNLMRLADSNSIKAQKQLLRTPPHPCQKIVNSTVVSSLRQTKTRTVETVETVIEVNEVRITAL